MGSCQFKLGNRKKQRQTHQMVDEVAADEKRKVEEFGNAAEPGAIVFAIWQGEAGEEDWLAQVCGTHRSGCDLVWETGHISHNVQRKHIRRPLDGVDPAREWVPGERCEAWWQGDAGGAVWQLCSIDTVPRGSLRCDVRWDDGSTSTFPRCWLRAPAGTPPRARHGAAQVADSHHPRLSGALECVIVAARDLPLVDVGSTGEAVAGDPYVQVFDDHGRELAKTHTVHRETNPVWDHACRPNGVPTGCMHIPDTRAIVFRVMDKDDLSADDQIGSACLCEHNGLSIVSAGGTFCAWLSLRGGEGQGQGEILVWLRPRPCQDPADESVGELSLHAVPGGRFPVRRGCRVTLFQSAHVGEWSERLAPVTLYADSGVPAGDTAAKLRHAPPLLAAPPSWMTDDDDGGAAPRPYLRRNCWEEQYVAIMQARLFIYVAGWSVNTDVTMLRDRLLSVEGPPEDPQKYERMRLTLGDRRLSIGELLKMKADEGVKVCVLLWREMFSSAGYKVKTGACKKLCGERLFASDGVAGTFSAQTRDYFEGTKVACRTVFREGVQKRMMMVISHHQKGVWCDAAPLTRDNEPLPDASRRRVIGFIGGLDLTKGRWDCPQKSIFRSLAREHGKAGGETQDFYSAILHKVPEHGEGSTVETGGHKFPVPPGTAEGPRQPWQDIHGKVEGAVARDMCVNFENRWRTQAHASTPASRGRSAEDLLPVGSDGGTVPLHASLLHAEEDVVFLDPHHPESWNVQYLRSIDRHSDSTCLGIEEDIHQAWLRAIAQSERFLYIENQYWMGASQHWKSDKLKGANEQGDQQTTNRIPMAICDRISRAIAEGKRYVCYVVMPLFPEGDPESLPIQEIMFWQSRTIEFMFHKVGKALKLYGVQGRPSDYLNFFCLGNREPGRWEASAKVPASCNPLAAQETQRSRVLTSCRNQIYVHSKMLIADDEYVIFGSANVNDRSMAGDRDSEHCVGCWQPAHSRDVGHAAGAAAAPPRRRGAIHAFRVSLWTEHLALLGPAPPPGWVLEPESIGCVREVVRRSERAWRAYAQEHAVELPCHLMLYPIRPGVGSDGGWKDTDGDGWMDGSAEPVQKYLPDHPKALTEGAESWLVADFMTS